MPTPDRDADTIRPDHAVAELAAAKPRLRDDLKFTFHESGGRPSYILEDLASRRYFQIGPVEFRFLRSFKGKQTLREILAAHAGDVGRDALDERQAQTLLRWAIDQELLQTEDSEQHERRIEHSSERQKKKPKRFVQEFLFLKIPLGNPDPFLNVVSPWLNWTVSPLAVFVWLLVLLAAGYEAASHWRELARAAGAAVLPGNWILLLVTFTALKLIHELWHGVVAKRFRAPVPEWGIRMLALVTPLTYVDASATWRLPSRWPRICVAAAGMYVELFIGAIAVFVWVHTGPGWLNTLAYNVIFSASVVTVLFNANPLMRFDGYYMLSDWLEIPNLSTKGQRFMMWASKKYLLGMKEEVLPLAIRERLPTIALYGFLAMIWRIVIWIGIMAIASNLFKGAGIVLVAAVLFASVLSAFARLFKFLFLESRGQRPNFFQAMTRVGLLIGVIAAVLVFVPVSPSPKLYAVIRHPKKEVMRVECPGFVHEIACANGEPVEEGQLLLTLENRIKTLELESLRLEAERSAIKVRKYLDEDLISSFQAENENLESLRQRLQVLEREVDSLTFRAPVSGRVVADRIDSLQGSYLATGQVALSILPGSDPELMVCIHQDDLEAVARRRDDDLAFRLRGVPGKFPARLDRSEARATTAVPHPALSALGGGPLMLRQKPDLLNERKQGLAVDRLAFDHDRYGFGELSRNQKDRALANQELVTPHLVAFATLPDNQGGWREGEWGIAKLTGGQRYRLGEWIYDGVSQYVRKTIERARRAG